MSNPAKRLLEVPVGGTVAETEYPGVKWPQNAALFRIPVTLGRNPEPGLHYPERSELGNFGELTLERLGEPGCWRRTG